MPLRYVASMLLGGLSDFGRRCSDVQLVTAASTRTTKARGCHSNDPTRARRGRFLLAIYHMQTGWARGTQGYHERVLGWMRRLAERHYCTHRLEALLQPRYVLPYELLDAVCRYAIAATLLEFCLSTSQPE